MNAILKAVGAAGAATGRLTLMFQDIANSTAVAELVGDSRWLELICDHNAIVRERVRACGGREVADRGDGFMVVFSEPRDGVDCAVSIQQALALYSCEHDARIEAQIGLHAGRPLQHQGQLYGTDVNLTARIADDVAQAGEILVSRHLRDLLPSEQGLAFDDGREVELKGLSGKHEVFGVLWREPTGATRLLSSALRPR